MDSTPTRTGPHPYTKVVYADILSFFFAAVGIAFIVAFIDALRTESIAAGFVALKASPYGLSALTDYFVGACFAVMFIYMREGPSFLCLNYKVVAFLSPIIGSPLPLFYIGCMLYTQKDVRRTFVPKSVEPGDEPVYDPPANTRQTRSIGLAFLALLTFFIGVCVWAFTTQSLSDGLADFRREKWIAVTFKDNLAGLLLPVIYVIIREGGLLRVVIPWILGFALLGNAATCAYVIYLAHESLRRDVSFPTLLFSQSRPA